MSQAETRLAGAEQLVCSYALTNRASREAVLEALDEDSLLTPQAEEVRRALRAHREEDRVTAMSLRALGTEAEVVEWCRVFEGEAYQHPFERATESLRACRAYAVVQRVLEAGVDDCVNQAMTDSAVAQFVGDLADVLQGLGADASERATGERSSREWAEEWRQRFLEDVKHGSCTWGARTLDHRAGTFAPGTLTAVAGLPGHGKSVLAMNAARSSAALGKRVLYVCLEMAEPELAKRLMCNAADEWAHNIEEAARFDDAYWKELLAKMPDVSLHVCGLMEARRLVRQAHARGEPFNLVVFDYLQMFKFGSERDNEATRLQEAVYFMKKDIAMRYRCATLVLCQFSKQETGRSDDMPSFRNVRGASAIEDAVDVAVCIKRDAEPTGELTYGAKSYALDFIVPKFRNGEPHPEERKTVRLFGGKFKIEDPAEDVRETIY